MVNCINGNKNGYFQESEVGGQQCRIMDSVGKLTIVPQSQGIKHGQNCCFTETKFANLSLKSDTEICHLKFRVHFCPTTVKVFNYITSLLTPLLLSECKFDADLIFI